MKENVKDTAKKEYKQLKKFISNLPSKDYKSGGWFLKLIGYSLETYSQKMTYKYFMDKYDGLNPDAIIDKRIKLAKNYAGIAGATATTAYTSAIIATIGSKGGASPVTIPAAGISFMVDLSYVSHLQLRLAYDISVIYGSPLDYTDPEDLQVLLVLAFGIKAGEVFSNSISRATPEGIRILVKQVFKKDTLKWLKALPYVGKYLLQRNIIKAGIPVVGIPLSYFVNRLFTGGIGKRAKKIFRIKIAINNIVADYPIMKINDYELLLEMLWICIAVDKKISSEKIWLLKEFVDSIRNNGGENIVDEFSRKVVFDNENIIYKLSQKSDEEKVHYLEAAYMSITVTHYPKEKEIELLKTLCDNCDIQYNINKVKKYHDMFHSN